jgi:6,7-dimethyl-8-ribityllumazine synthase
MKKILIINANYYENISSLLIENTKKIFIKYKIKNDIIKVPGIFEIPVTIKKYIKNYDGFVALGCVIKGETPHFDLICNSTFDAIIKMSVDYNKPIGNGIITAFNMKQAVARSSTNKNSKKPNKGLEAAKAVIAVLKNEPKKT